MTTVNEILTFLETIAPPDMAEAWDNVGLLCGSSDWPVTRILVVLDPFESVIDEAIALGTDLIVTHHPLIFREDLTAVNDKTQTGRCVLKLLTHRIAAINAHTNLDHAPGGVNDALAGALGLTGVEILDPQGTDAQGRPWGLIRMGQATEQPLEPFLGFVQERLHCDGLRYCNGGRPVHKIAVGGGSCAAAVGVVAEAGCDTFVTADVKYNQFRTAYELGVNLIDAGHFHTENPVVAVLAAKLQAQFPEIAVKISETHWDCMKFY